MDRNDLFWSKALSIIIEMERKPGLIAGLFIPLTLG
jgi:hypothetical protein